jgi:hypothetical protein
VTSTGANEIAVAPGLPPGLEIVVRQGGAETGPYFPRGRVRLAPAASGGLGALNPLRLGACRGRRKSACAGGARRVEEALWDDSLRRLSRPAPGI